jgi:hypothetical protein
MITLPSCNYLHDWQLFSFHMVRYSNFMLWFDDSIDTYVSMDDEKVKSPSARTKSLSAHLIAQRLWHFRRAAFLRLLLVSDWAAWSTKGRSLWQ